MGRSRSLTADPETLSGEGSPEGSRRDARAAEVACLTGGEEGRAVATQAAEAPSAGARGADAGGVRPSLRSRPVQAPRMARISPPRNDGSLLSPAP